MSLQFDSTTPLQEEVPMRGTSSTAPDTNQQFLNAPVSEVPMPGTSSTVRDTSQQFPNAQVPEVPLPDMISSSSSEDEGDAFQSPTQSMGCNGICCNNITSPNQPQSCAYLSYSYREKNEIRNRHFVTNWYKLFPWLHVCEQRKKSVLSHRIQK